MIRELLERGHEVHLVFEREDGAPGPLEQAWLRRMERHPHFHWSSTLAWRRDPWFRVARPVRGALDYVYFLQLGEERVPVPAPARRAGAPRARSSCSCGSPGMTSRADAARSGRRCSTSATARSRQRARPAADPRLAGPDVVLVTPHLMPSSTDAHYARSAVGAGVPTGDLHRQLGQPLQQAAAPRRARPRHRLERDPEGRRRSSLHGVPADRVVATGAQCFDHWFGWPPRPREEFCARVGLDPAKPYILYVGGSLFPSTMTEAEYCAEWIEAVRASDEPALRDGGHPDPAASEPDRGVARASTSPCFEDVVVWPPNVVVPVEQDTRADYFDSIYHSAVVFGDEHERDDRGRDHRQGRAHDHRPRVRRLAGRRAPLPLPARGRRRARPGLGDARGERPAARRRRRRAATRRARRRRGGSPSCSSGRTASRCRRRPSSSTRSRSSPSAGRASSRLTPAGSCSLRAAARADPGPLLLRAQVRHEGSRTECAASSAPPRPGTAAVRVRVLFSAETPLSLTSYQSVIARARPARARGRRRDPRGARDRLARPAARGGGRAARHGRARGRRRRATAGWSSRPTCARRSTSSSSSGRGSTRPTARARGGGRRSRPPRWPARRSARSARGAARDRRRLRAGRAGGADERRDRAVPRATAARTSSCSRRTSACARSSPTSCAPRRRSGCARRSASRAGTTCPASR